jgi:hypothetical protein
MRLDGSWVTFSTAAAAMRRCINKFEERKGIPVMDEIWSSIRDL